MFRRARREKLERGWSAVSIDPKLKSGELAVLLDRLSTGELLALVELTLAERRKAKAWPQRFWLEELALLGVLAIAALAVWNGMWLKGAAARKQVVVASRELPAFHKIQKQDIKLAPPGSEPEAFNDMAQVINRFTIAKVSSAAVLKPKYLAPADWPDPAVTSSWRVIAVPLKASAGELGRSDLPRRVTLVASPHSEKTAPGVFDGILLDYALTGDAKTAVVALRNEDVPRFASVAGESDFFLLRELN